MHRLSVLILCLYCFACKSVQGKEPQKNRNSAVRGATLAGQLKPTEESPAKSSGGAPANDSAKEAVAPRATPVASTEPIQNRYEYRDFMRNVEDEHKRFGTAERAKKYKRKKYGNSVVEQRSGRRRLYDHNIFLRALLEGKLQSGAGENLGEPFKDAVFLDIGSAILYGEGADTVRDLYEDKKIHPHLTIIASDVNDPGNKKTMYVDIYRKTRKSLPFPVVEVAMLMDRPVHFTGPLKLFLKDAETAVILRSANAGPDLYYTPKQVQKHLRAAVLAFYERDLIYLFNKYILYKAKKRPDFLIIGEIDEEVGTNHRETTWNEIDWKTRTFDEAVRINRQHVTYD